MLRENALKAALAAGQPTFGLINSTGSAVVAEMIGLAGYDFVLIDGEHAPGDQASYLACLHAVMSTKATALFRVASNDPVHIKRALDLGVEGIMIPDVRDANAARAAIDACHYPPKGTRGSAARLIRASDYGFSIDRYDRGFGAGELFICLMIESRSAIDDIDAIAAIDGYDALLIGPYDLSGSLGVPGRFDHPAFRDAVARVEAAALKRRKALGGAATATDALEQLIARGYRFLTNGSDVAFLREAFTRDLKRARGSAS